MRTGKKNEEDPRSPRCSNKNLNLEKKKNKIKKGRGNQGGKNTNQTKDPMDLENGWSAFQKKKRDKTCRKKTSKRKKKPSIKKRVGSWRWS